MVDKDLVWDSPRPQRPAPGTLAFVAGSAGQGDSCIASAGGPAAWGSVEAFGELEKRIGGHRSVHSSRLSVFVVSIQLRYYCVEARRILLVVGISMCAQNGLEFPDIIHWGVFGHPANSPLPSSAVVHW